MPRGARPLFHPTPADAAAVLEPEQRFLLWAVRAWVACCRAGLLPAAPVLSVFERLGLPEAEAALEDALVMLARSAARRLAVHCPGCPGLSEDETLLLDAAAAAQHRDVAAGRHRLAGLVPATAVDAVLDAFAEFGTLLALAGLMLPEPEAPVARGRVAAPLSRSLH